MNSENQTVLTAVVSALAASGIAGGTVWAAIGDRGVIEGCYDSGGSLKVVSALPCPDGAPASGQILVAFAKPTGKEA